MRITAKLACSQLKINRLRTLGSLAAIALSTALMTAVCSFVASGNAMLVGLLGSDYGAYGQSYMGLLLVPAILFSIIIITMSVVVISNVFRISANERMAQFGILKCVGATGKQISSTVLYESIFLSAVGIPAGMILGLCLTFVGIHIANVFLNDLNDLTNIMINDIHLSLAFVFSGQALLIAAMICFLTVLFSAWWPGHRAAKVPAIDSVRGVGTIKVRKTKMRTNPIVQKLFGFEGVLASINIQRNRQNFRTTVSALTVGVILFIALGALSQQANQLEAYMQPAVDETVISEYSSDRIWQTNDKTGRDESVYLCPITSDVGNIVAERLREYDGKSIFGAGADLETYHTVLPAAFLSEQMTRVLPNTEQDTYELPVEIITLDEYHYQALCKKAGVSTGATILLNHYSYNDSGTEVHFTPYLSNLQSVKLIKADGSQSELTIDGVVTQEDIPKELLYFNTNPVRLVVQQAEVRNYSWYSTPEDESDFITYANSVLAEMFSVNESSDHMDEGFKIRVYKIDDFTKVMNIAIMLVSVFMYSFVALLMLIGFTNIVSTMSTNVLMRAHDFAVLQSVGMTMDGVKRMLALESILCSLKALLVGLPVGIGITFLVNLPIRSMYPIPYKFPWLSVLLCVLGVFGITWGTTLSAAHKLRKQNIIETIRTQNGR